MKFSAQVLYTCMALCNLSSVHAFAPRGLAFVSSLATRSFGSTLNAPTRRFMSVDSTSTNQKLPIIVDESVMSPKAHGTSEKPVMRNLRWNCDYDTADRICNFNRHYAEYAGYWQTTDFLKEIDSNSNEPVTFHDSVTGELLFTAPIGRTMKDFLLESQKHGWPSFRDSEVNWEHVRCLSNGECISKTGTHLGHNIPDSSGNRYCINLVSVAGQPSKE